MPSPYPILRVLPDEVVRDEPLGSKTKFWFDQRGHRSLFKQPREGTGEDWAEKVAGEIATRIGVSAATIDLAVYEGQRGSASLSFVDRSAGEALIHGNEILAGNVVGYDPRKAFGQSEHTVGNIHKGVIGLFPESERQVGALKKLGSYLVLDALIGNTDRHHENWGVVMRISRSVGGPWNFDIRVAPSFDHASSLGRELPDHRRAAILTSGSIESYVRAGRGAVFLAASDAHGANPLRLVEIGASQYRDYLLPALRQVSDVELARLLEVVDRIPVHLMSDDANRFAKAFLTYTYGALCNLAK
jgi:hypothetical protein